MFLPSDQKSNNPFLPGSSIVTGHYPPDPDRSAGAAPDFMQQQMYAPPPGPPNQRNYNSEAPPPAYDSVPSAGARALNIDAKSDPRDVQSVHPMTPEPFAGPSEYAGPPAITQTARGGFSGPSSFRPDRDPQYTSSYLAPPTSPSRNLLSFSGGNVNAQNLTQSPGAPPSFYRPAAQNLFYNTFPPTYLIANGKNLGSGFPVIPPPSPVQPHPFISHDVNEADWTRFLGDLKKTATLSGGQKLAAGGAGLLAPSFMTGLIVSSVVKNVMKDKKNKPMGELIDSWNHHFFHPRRLEVILAKGQDRVDGLGPVPNIDPQIEQMAPRLTRTSRSSSISSSSSSSSSNCSGSRRDRRERKREDRQIRREEKRDRRERKRERRQGKRVDRGGYDRKYRLFVVGL